MEKVRIEGAELACETAGAGEPVVLIHGAFIADAFRPLLAGPGLTGRYRLVLYHRRGYGESSRASGVVSVPRQAADCGALLRYLGVERAHVVGHSYGGAVALQLALDTPGMVHSLALLEPALMVGSSAEGYRESLAKALARYREAGAAVVVDESLEARSPGYRVVLDRVLPGAFARALVDAQTTFECELPGLMSWHFGEAEARRIRRPTLSVLGEASDALWSRFGETHRLLLSSVPNAEEFVLPGAAHLLQIEDPLGMAEGLASFWTRHPLPTEFLRLSC